MLNQIDKQTEMGKANFYDFKNKIAFMEDACKIDCDIHNYVLFFNKTKTLETLCGKDVSAFSVVELINMFDKLGWTFSSTFYYNKCLLAEYINWCKKSNEILQEDIKKDDDRLDNLTFETMSGRIHIEEEYFKSFEDLKDCMIYVYEMYNIDENYYNMGLSFYGLLWFGLTQKEIMQLTKSNFDFMRGRVTLPDGTIFDDIDVQLIDICCECFETNTFHIEADDKMKVYKYQVSDYLIRNTERTSSDSEDRSDYLFSKQRSRRWKELTYQLGEGEKYRNKVLVPTSILRCGQFNLIYNYEQEFGRIDNENSKILEKILRPSSLSKMYHTHKSYFQWRKYYYGY